MRLRVKVCGITRPDDARAAADLGADAIGVVLAPGSPRQVDRRQAAAIAAALPPFVPCVGVLVDQDPSGWAAWREVGVQVLQFHGEEEPAACARSPLPWYKAHRVAPGFDPARLDAYGCPFHLLDAWHAALRGGTGQGVDRDIAAAAARRHPILLAGGLTPDNVLEAVEKVCPAGIDVNSGVETAPGRKDRAKLTLLFARLCAAGYRG